MTDEPTLREEPQVGLRKVLNQHGYGFQYAVLERCLGAISKYADPPWKHRMHEAHETAVGMVQVFHVG